MSTDRPLVVSSAAESGPQLRARFQEYGYLYFPRYVAQERCENLLWQMLDCLVPHVAYSAELGRPVLQGEPFFESDALWDELYPRVQSLYDFHHFFHDTALQKLMRTVADDEVFVYPMKMGRVATPRRIGFETPPHQDAHSHQGGPTMAGIWVALHDASAGMGRLKLLPGSHKQGVRRVFEADGVGGVQCEIFAGETEWHVSDVSQGDVIIFHACCVHRAEPNTSDSAVRISVDTRFAHYGAPVFVTNLEPHHGWRIDELDWDLIYADWPESELKYYWRDYPNFSEELIHPL